MSLYSSKDSKKQLNLFLQVDRLLAMALYKIINLETGDICPHRKMPVCKSSAAQYTRRDLDVILMTMRDLEGLQRLLHVLYAMRHLDIFAKCSIERSFHRDYTSFKHNIYRNHVVVSHSQRLHFTSSGSTIPNTTNFKEQKELTYLEERLPGLKSGIILLTRLDVEIHLPHDIIIHDTKRARTQETPINYIVKFSTKEAPADIRKCVLSIKMRGIFVHDSDISFNYNVEGQVVTVSFIHRYAALIAQASYIDIETVEYSRSKHIYQPFPCTAQVEYMRLPADMEESLRLCLQRKMDAVVFGEMIYLQKLTGDCATTIYKMTDTDSIYIHTSLASFAEDSFDRKRKFFNIIQPIDVEQVEEPAPDEAVHEVVAEDIYIDSREQIFLAQHKGISFDVDEEMCITLINVAHKPFVDAWAASCKREQRRSTAFLYKFCYAD